MRCVYILYYILLIFRWSGCVVGSGRVYQVLHCRLEGISRPHIQTITNRDLDPHIQTITNRDLYTTQAGGSNLCAY